MGRECRGGRVRTRGRAAEGKPRWRSGPQISTRSRAHSGKKIHQPIDPGLAALDRAAGEKACTRRDSRLPVSRKSTGAEFFAALIESEELKIGRRMIEPRHSLRGGAPCACRDDHFEAAKVTASFAAALAAVVEPENARA